VFFVENVPYVTTLKSQFDAKSIYSQRVWGLIRSNNNNNIEYDEEFSCWQ